MASKKNFLWKVFNNGGAFLLLLAVTFVFLFRDTHPTQLIKTIAQVNPLYLLVGIGAMPIFILCEAVNIGRSLKLFGYHPRFWQCIKYSSAGFFFSSITPSASGGQPMQIYYMHKDKIELSHSALALLLDLASYQLVTVSFALLGLVTHYRMILNSIGNAQFVLFIGLAFNLCVLIFIVTAIFSKKLSNCFIAVIGRILTFFKYKNTAQFYKKAQEHLQEYQKCASFFLNNKGTILKNICTTCVQIASAHSIPYWVYRSFGLSSSSFFTIFAMQAVLYISVSALPLPGSVGASESGFLKLFKAFFPVQLLSSSMLLSRGISFYLFVFITGVMLGFYSIAVRKKSPVKNNLSANTQRYFSRQQDN